MTVCEIAKYVSLVSDIPSKNHLARKMQVLREFFLQDLQDLALNLFKRSCWLKIKIIKKALDISLALEAANKDTKQFQVAALATPSNIVLVHKVRGRGEIFTKHKIYCCWKLNHKAPKCHNKDSVCLKCKKKGYLSKVWHSTKNTGTPSHPHNQGLKPLQTNMVISSTRVPEE